jgi:hypothetical protein
MLNANNKKTYIQSNFGVNLNVGTFVATSFDQTIVLLQSIRKTYSEKPKG